MSGPETGQWLDKTLEEYDLSLIKKWQSCKCSVCGHYDIRPYLCFFVEPHYYSWCGACMTNNSIENCDD